MNETDKNAEMQANQAAEPSAALQGADGTANASLEVESDLSDKLAQAEAQATEYLDNWRRAVADLSNARKRMQREQDEMRRTASARVLEKLIPILDDVDRAFANMPSDQANSEWVNGFRLIQKKLQGLLESEGVTTIPAEGQQFDPKLHYAVTHEDSEDLEEGQIIAEVAKGYKLDDKVLRPSMVRVARGS